MASTRLRHPWDSPGKNTGVGYHFLFQCMKVKSEREVAQSCPTLCDPMDHSLPGSSVHGIFQARVLEWGAMTLVQMNSGALSESRKVRMLGRISHGWADVCSSDLVQLCMTPWTAAYQAPPSLGFSRQEYWSGLPLPSLNLGPAASLINKLWLL